MTMEHRWGTREPATLEVTIVSGPLTNLTGHLRDFSASGVFVETADGPPPFAQVELVCVLRGRGLARILRFEAVVSRRTREGVGLQFLHLNPAGLEDLRAYARSARLVRRVATAPEALVRADSSSAAAR